MMDTVRKWVGSSSKGISNKFGELEKKLNDTNATPMSLPLEFLKSITCDFSTESVLGEGGYGVVYKGVLQSGKIIAVKKLNGIHLDDQMFQNEVSYLMAMKHQNIVKFVGYCAESISEMIEKPSGSGRYILAEMPKRLLCLEYISNQSLDKHISDESSGLEWNMRYEIIKGICNGLHFLHEQCRIVHLDLKPQNILMDSFMTAKITDFGVSRIFGEKQSRAFTANRVGTLGFMAPEYLIRGEVSNKADIFSLGVIVIEIITGHRNYPDFMHETPNNIATSSEQFIEKVLGSWRNKLLSRKYKCLETYTQQVRECITIALKCVDSSMEKRPNIKDIIQRLNDLDQLAIPQFIHTFPNQMGCEQRMVSLDVNQTKAWIITGHDFGYIHIFDYDIQKSIGSDTGDGNDATVIKFIERKQWFVVGLSNGYINVYTYETKVQKITSFRAKGSLLPNIYSLAIHPTEPYVLSSCNGNIQLWDWDKNWQCIRTFEKSSYFSLQYELTFNPIDTTEFASAERNEVKVWNVGSLRRNYTLYGHSDEVKCLDFFKHDDNQQYLITGSSDRTVKIWDMQKRSCVHTLEGFMSPVIFVGSNSRLLVLITCTKDGVVHLWSATNFRFKRVINTGSPAVAYGLACLTGSERVAMRNKTTLFMVDIADEEPDALAGNEEPSAS
uniref:Uncharacterized protein n=2 Tax=Avena sativa TaxID=4498 RepID=A0ACD5TSF7_AVESA